MSRFVEPLLDATRIIDRFNPHEADDAHWRRTHVISDVLAGDVYFSVVFLHRGVLRHWRTRHRLTAHWGKP